jgi:hypothetical protein
MQKVVRIFFSCLLFFPALSFAQTDAFAGTWRMYNLPDSGNTTVSIELQIAAPEKGLLYPAYIKLQCGSFTAGYQLLLVKKSSRELGISRNKYPVTETPFSLGAATIFLNGILDYSRDFKGNPLLTVMRMQSRAGSAIMPDTVQLDEKNKTTARQLISFLKTEEIRFKKITDNQWVSEDAARIVSPSVSPAYFGLLDTVYLRIRDGFISFSGEKKKEADIVSVMLNGRQIFDRITVNKKKHTEEMLLDTGLNILAFFAENFGDALPGRGKLSFEFGKKKFALDFAGRADSAATFIVAKLYNEHDKGKDRFFRDYNTGQADRPLQRNEKLIGSIVATAQQIKLALWDDAVEDGDSISLNINGKWIARGFPVKKNPQFLTVTLQPGPNTITFMADNLGSIPPNTSILEIIDGKKRKSFSIETNLDQNNFIKIFYDIKAGESD